MEEEEEDSGAIPAGEIGSRPGSRAGSRASSSSRSRLKRLRTSSTETIPEVINRFLQQSQEKDRQIAQEVTL